MTITKFGKISVLKVNITKLVDLLKKSEAGNTFVDENCRLVERDKQSGEAVPKAAEAASLTIFCWSADCERLHLRVEIHLYITRQWALSCLQSNTD